MRWVEDRGQMTFLVVFFAWTIKGMSVSIGKEGMTKKHKSSIKYTNTKLVFPFLCVFSSFVAGIGPKSERRRKWRILFLEKVLFFPMKVI